MNTPMKDELMKAFGPLNAQQLWTLVKFAKHVRLRCRNNTAFNNFCNGTFPYAKFEQVSKVRASDGSVYPGLRITVNGETQDGEDEA